MSERPSADIGGLSASACESRLDLLLREQRAREAVALSRRCREALPDWRVPESLARRLEAAQPQPLPAPEPAGKSSPGSETTTR